MGIPEQIPLLPRRKRFGEGTDDLTGVLSVTPALRPMTCAFR